MYSYCCVIPVFNQAETAREIIRRARAQTPDVLVIDDASSDADLKKEYEGTDIKVIRHALHHGRGASLRTARKYLDGQKTDYMIVLEADGRFYPEDLPRFLPYLQENDFTIAVGSRYFTEPENSVVPHPSARRIAHTLFRIETGMDVHDVCSTFRAYPVKYVSQLQLISRLTDYETEILVRSAWANLEIRNLRVRCRTDRLQNNSFVRTFGKFLLTHAKLIALRLIPYPKKDLRPREKSDLKLLTPRNFLAYLMNENASPKELAAAAFLGTYCAVLPLLGFHTPVVLYFASVFHLNRFMAFMIQHPFVMLPITPFLCIELGYWMRHGEWLTNFDWQTWISGIGFRLWEWILGSLVLAPVFAVLMALTVYFLAMYFQKKIRLKFWQKCRK